MPSTPEIDAALATLKDMDQRIRDAQSNLRVLKAINSNAAATAEAKLAQAIRDRDTFVKALEDERNRPS